MSRLASFRGPSTPSSSPVRVKHTTPPSSPSKLVTESTYHRKVRKSLLDISIAADTWDDIVLIDGVKAARGLVDARTELRNELALIPAGTQPNYRLVQLKLSTMENRIAELDIILGKLKKQFDRMNKLVEGLESLLGDAYKAKGWEWVHREPLWVTWTLEKFVTSIPGIIVPYHRSLQMHINLVETLRSHDVSFEDSRDAITQWITQPYLEEGSWDAQWEDICAVEVEQWNK